MSYDPGKDFVRNVLPVLAVFALFMGCVSMNVVANRYEPASRGSSGSSNYESNVGKTPWD